MVGRARRTLEDIGEKYLSQIISCGSPALNLLWLKENEAENYHRLYKFLIGPDWLVHQMTGSYLGTDYCEASTSSLFNLSKKKWSYAAIDALGLSRALLPNVRSSAEIAGTLHDEYAKALGLSRGIPVIVGTGDNPASALATGCLQNNLPVLSLGTSGVLMFTRPHFDPAFKGKNIQVSLQGNDVINLVQGTVQACGLSFSWWNKSILMRDSFDEVESEITAEFEQSPTRKPLIYYPHISGEKTIYGDASLTGAFIGLTSDVTRAQMTLAVMEGVAFGVCQLAEEMQVSLTDFDALKVIGGGSKSDTWMRVLSSVLNVTTVRSESYASASFGAALLALSALRGNSSLVQRNLPVDTMQQFHPNEGLLRHYESVYSKFLRVHDAIKLVLGDRSEVSS
ncbi:hypothetical protein HMPREF2826_01365 [Olsenella sp. HMSC062G07]|nr:hypothetical protein HMPREF2826_01365 [Olsenella sp. HMSC062G07]